MDGRSVGGTAEFEVYTVHKEVQVGIDIRDAGSQGIGKTVGCIALCGAALLAGFVRGEEGECAACGKLPVGDVVFGNVAFITFVAGHRGVGIRTECHTADVRLALAFLHPDDEFPATVEL